MASDESNKLAKFFSSVIPLGRWGESEEVAKAVLFLASDDSSYVNAVELMVDGGGRVRRLELPFFAADLRARFIFEQREPPSFNQRERR